MNRCKIYEIEGPDDGRRWGAIRCQRDANTVRDLEHLRGVPICERHTESRWSVFVRDGWIYAIDTRSDLAITDQ